MAKKRAKRKKYAVVWGNHFVYRNRPLTLSEARYCLPFYEGAKAFELVPTDDARRAKAGRKGGR